MTVAAPHERRSLIGSPVSGNVGSGRSEPAEKRGERFAPLDRELSGDKATTLLADYERRTRYLAPLIRRLLSWLVGWRYDGTESARERLVAELPFGALRPADVREPPAVA
jgi:hypothetical protein